MLRTTPENDFGEGRDLQSPKSCARSDDVLIGTRRLELEKQNMAIPIKPNPQAQETGETRLRLALPLHLNRWMWFAIAGIFAVQTGVLRLEGRRWWCACGG